MGDLLIEAEEFEEYGGWVLDSQFVMEMGSPYLLAHGSGRPVADARTVVDIAQAGSYSVWVRSKDWVPVHHPGRFELSLGNKRLATEFGGNGQDWSWQSAGDIELNAGPLEVTLHDLTGFDGRCDAIFLSRDGNEPVEGAGHDARAWRRRLRDLPDDPTPKGPFDLVIVGGGVTGSVGALVATRLGLRVAVVQNRPVLGGNASVEIGIGPRGERGTTVAEAIARTPDGDLQVGRLLEAEPGATVFLHHQVFGVSMDGDSINSVDACEAVSGREIRISGSQFIDCTGTAILGILANTPTMFGIEGAGEYSESHAPPERLNQHHGHTIFFRTRIADDPVEFPDVPWAIEVAKDFADLGGQAEAPGKDNGDGPVAEAFRPPEDDKFANLTRRLTHYWEYGQWCDPYTEGEHIRDHLLRAVYGTMSNIKILEPEKWANLEFDWVAHVPGQGEFRRYIGDHVLSENDIRNHVKFPDAVVKNSGAFCLHHPIHEDYDFRLKNWTWDERDDEPFDIPFRCLYSAHVSNLMMAGKHISVTHVAGSVCKFMGNGAQHAIATAAAASIAIKYGATPRQVHDNHLRELQNLIVDTLGAE
ncbi:MAG: FAD-dependent oxidoreductase [Ilumatobacter sp.]|nr:FAD-dependent oxidoreductase [Ilumatobacter sp.]